MLTFIRLYRFHRRCSMTRRRSFTRAFGTVLRDLQLNRRF